MPNHPRSGFCLAAFLLAAAFLHGQSSGTTQPPAAPLTLRSRVRIVLLDVLVTDNQGRPVKGLSRDDFQLRENGKVQGLDSVEEHDAAAGLQRTPQLPAGTFSSGVFTNRLPPSGQVWNIVLFDLLNTTTQDQTFAFRQLERFIKQLPASEPIALVLMAAQSKLVASFNDGAGSIARLFAHQKLTASTSPLLDIYNNNEEELTREMVRNQQALQAISETRDSVEMGRLALRVEAAMNNFSAVADWLSQYPGRKNVYWLSTGFPLFASPLGSLAASSSSSPSEAFLSEFAIQQQEMDKRLQDARVSIFPIDVAGVTGATTQGVDDIETQGGDYVGAVGAARMSQQRQKSTTREMEQYSEMKEIADATGGVMRRNNNDLAGMLNEEFHRSQDFYTLAYTPTEKDWNGSYRKINLSLRRSGYDLTYRRGYYALDAKVKPTTRDDFTLALRPGAAPATDVLFSAKLRQEAGQLVLDYAIDPQSLKFTPGDDGRQFAGVDCAVAEFDLAGKLLGTAAIHVDGRVRPEQWAALSASGFPASQKVPAAKGAAYVTIGIRDSATGKFGNLAVAMSTPDARQ